MQGQGDLYTSIKTRMEEAKYAHEKELRIIKRRRAEFKKTMGLVGTVLFTWVFFMGFLFAVLWAYRQGQ